MNASLRRIERICCARETGVRLVDRAAFFMSQPHRRGSLRLRQWLSVFVRPRIGAELQRSIESSATSVGDAERFIAILEVLKSANGDEVFARFGRLKIGRAVRNVALLLAGRYHQTEGYGENHNPSPVFWAIIMSGIEVEGLIGVNSRSR